MCALRHNCGLCVTHSLHDAYGFIKSLQHRGREAAGIGGITDEGRIDVLTWSGQVDRFDTGNLHYIFHGSYHTFLGHVRYATRGRKDRILEDAHPIVIGGEKELREDHVIIRDCEVMGVHNGQVDDKYLEGIGSVSLETGTDTEKLLHFYREFGEIELLKRVPGASTMAIADRRKKEVIVLRDRTGIRPGALGWKDGNYVAASEDVAFRENGGEFSEDMSLGSVYYLSPDGSSFTKENVVEPRPSFCFFEYDYLAHVLSNLNDLAVGRVRKRLGEKLAEEFRPEGLDFVTYMPRCPRPAARSYAEKLGAPFLPVFYKPRAERAFQGSTAWEREDSISKNLWLLPEMREKLKGKRVLCVDDSVIRGNNSKRARHLLYDVAEVKEAFLLSYTPKIGIIGEDGIPRGCKWGVDMPPDDDFVARNRTDKEIEEKIGMPVRYLSLDGMLSVFDELGIPRGNLCTYCVGGPHPFEV